MLGQLNRFRFDRTITEVLWWKFMPGTIITVKWPVDSESSDPNDHYRPWLEQNVGKQNWDWNWRIKIGLFSQDDGVVIKFRKGKEDCASMASLKWK